MSGTTTTSYGLALAPGGLFLAQELANTGLPLAREPDPLQDLEAAGAWLQGAFTEWSHRTGQPAPDASLTARDVPKLRVLRVLVREWLTTGEPASPSTSTLHVSLGPGRGVSYGPTSSGVAALLSLIAVEALLARRSQTLERLKVCANRGCGAVFYDESRNASRRWHDVKVCGNAVNLRASRARRAAQASTGEHTVPGDR
ncbi:CGNR zinc finger domain-containing protein [Kineococcus sp. SYSU DK005]|uniref:CGNR zinc finger domain-containing protein n=1 Tax=Kineococcus sp. SYSU DK005 TaxID=3383126 RepID=UPI003D7D3C8A